MFQIVMVIYSENQRKQIRKIDQSETTTFQVVRNDQFLAALPNLKIHFCQSRNSSAETKNSRISFNSIGWFHLKFLVIFLKSLREKNLYQNLKTSNNTGCITTLIKNECCKLNKRGYLVLQNFSYKTVSQYKDFLNNLEIPSCSENFLTIKLFKCNTIEV